ncbi:MAG: hypothetical protein LBN74_03015 [Prevotella sp.]|nr:hypothetical protein [Prevotella sp.]
MERFRINLRNVAIIFACLAVVMITACNGGGNKRSNGDATDTKTKSKASATAALEVTDDAKTILATYSLTAEAVAPQNAIYTFLPFGQEREVVGFLQTKGTKKAPKRDFTKMIEGIKAASDDGKIYNALSDDLEFDMNNLVTDYAVGHEFQYISKGKHIKVYLAWGSGFVKPGTEDSYPIYRITFKEQ